MILITEGFHANELTIPFDCDNRAGQHPKIDLRLIPSRDPHQPISSAGTPGRVRSAASPSRDGESLQIGW